jgi:hypothetical protein
MTDGVFQDAAYVAVARWDADRWRLFLILVSLASLLPFAVAPLAVHVIPPENPAMFSYALIALLGANVHVACTGWFYTDPQMRAHFAVRPARYLVAPVLLVMGSAATFYVADRPAIYYLIFAFLCWQLWHYQKQNVGLLSFVAAGTGKVPVSIWERRTLMLAAVAGILGFFRINQGPSVAFIDLYLPLHQAGLAIYLVLVPIAFCLALLRCPALLTNRLRLAFFCYGTLFFAPVFVFKDQISATAGYALAHGLQYVVFMGFVSAGRQVNLRSLIKLGVIALCGGLFLDQLWSTPNLLDKPFGTAIYGALLGVTLSHFVIDAGVWRLREPFQRGYMREKFDFIFRRS